MMALFGFIFMPRCAYLVVQNYALYYVQLRRAHIKHTPNTRPQQIDRLRTFDTVEQTHASTNKLKSISSKCLRLSSNMTNLMDHEPIEPNLPIESTQHSNGWYATSNHADSNAIFDETATNKMKMGMINGLELPTWPSLQVSSLTSLRHRRMLKPLSEYDQNQLKSYFANAIPAVPTILEFNSEHVRILCAEMRLRLNDQKNSFTPLDLITMARNLKRWESAAVIPDEVVQLAVSIADRFEFIITERKNRDQKEVSISPIVTADAVSILWSLLYLNIPHTHLFDRIVSETHFLTQSNAISDELLASTSLCIIRYKLVHGMRDKNNGTTDELSRKLIKYVFQRFISRTTVSFEKTNDLMLLYKPTSLLLDFTGTDLLLFLKWCTRVRWVDCAAFPHIISLIEERLLNSFTQWSDNRIFSLMHALFKLNINSPILIDGVCSKYVESTRDRNAAFTSLRTASLVCLIQCRPGWKPSMPVRQLLQKIRSIVTEELQSSRIYLFNHKPALRMCAEIVQSIQSGRLLALKVNPNSTDFDDLIYPKSIVDSLKDLMDHTEAPNLRLSDDQHANHIEALAQKFIIAGCTVDERSKYVFGVDPDLLVSRPVQIERRQAHQKGSYMIVRRTVVSILRKKTDYFDVGRRSDLQPTVDTLPTWQPSARIAWMRAVLYANGVGFVPLFDWSMSTHPVGSQGVVLKQVHETLSRTRMVQAPIVPTRRFLDNW